MINLYLNTIYLTEKIRICRKIKIVIFTLYFEQNISNIIINIDIYLYDNIYIKMFLLYLNEFLIN